MCLLRRLRILNLAMLLIGLLVSGTGQALTLLPGDALHGPAAGLQNAPDIAASDSRFPQRFLAVWADLRTSPGTAAPFSPEGGGSDIYGRCLDADGIPTGPPFIIAANFTVESRPQVAWNGRHWLVAWTSPWELWSYTSQMLAVRIAPDCLPVEESPLVILNDVSGLALTAAGTDPDVGTEWLALDPYSTRAVRIAPNGTLINPGGTPLFHPTTILVVNIASTFNAASGQREYLLASWDTTSTSSPQGRRYNTDLTSIGAPFPLPGITIAAAEEGYFVSWSDNTTYWNDYIYGQRLSAHGIFGPRLTLTGAGAQLPLWTPVQLRNGWDGSNWWVAWLETTRGVTFSRVSPDDQVLDFGGIAVDSATTAPDSGGFGLTGAPGGGAQLAWSERRDPSPTGDLHSVSVPALGLPQESQLLATAAPSQNRIALAAGDQQLLAVFMSESPLGEPQLLGQRLDGAGNAVDAEPFLIAAGNGFSAPKVAHDGSRYLVVWSRNGQVQGTRISNNGTLIDSAPLALMEGSFASVSGHDGTFLVVATQPTISAHFMHPFSLRIDGNSGARLDSAPVILGQYFARYPTAAWVGSRWLVAWQRNPTHDNPINSIWAAFVNAEDGSSSDEFLVMTGGTPALAVSADRVLLVARTNRPGSSANDIIGRLMDFAGTFSTSEFFVSNLEDQQFAPAASWNGREFVVSWTDKRHAVAYFDERTEVFAARVDPGGGVIDPQGFAFGDRALEGDSALATLNGHTLIAASRFTLEPLLPGAPPADSFRVALESYPAAGWPIAIAGPLRTSGDIPLGIVFDSDGSQAFPRGSVSVNWSFDDGAAASAATPFHNYTEAGNYLAELRVADGSGVETRNTVRVVATPSNAPPRALASASPLSAPAPLTVTFRGDASFDEDQGIQNYRWDFSDGGYYYGATAYHTFTQPGDYSATLTVTDYRGASDTSAPLTLHVDPSNQPPTAVASATPLSGWTPLLVSFSSAASSDTDGSIVGYLWRFGDGSTSVAPAPNHTFEVGGLYTVMLTVTDNHGSSDTAYLDIDVMQSDQDNLAQNDYATDMGRVSAGSYLDTHRFDGSAQALTESETTGKPSLRYSGLEHIWRFDVMPGVGYHFYVTAYHTANAEEDHFGLDYSRDGAGWTPMLVVSDTEPTGTPRAYRFQEDIGGSLYIRARDSDRTPGNRSLDTLYVEEMRIVTSWTAGDSTPPAAPTGLVATAGDRLVSLDWLDNSDPDLDGYLLYRSTSAGGPFATVNNAPLSNSAYLDTGLTNATTYYYLVHAIDLSGNESADSPVVSATPASPGSATLHVAAINLSLSSGKRARGQAEVQIRDNRGNPVAGAEVSGSFTLFDETASAVTDGAGNALLVTRRRTSGDPGFSFCVDAVLADGYTYLPADNVESCDTR